ncbi:hypothetical protein BO94DRAFT_583303 [Aspergillus sclerotioniger CBS 115572]|uniref:Uncharacterized protein n=1 Tax=Aspergillus sclerotioniger CBS 115572 TaxID=1450535 RepID=A0A317X357_9EURO|nr:hypothetical protein BO94DRAFT_583303 [Aspergillus sclerotioniger CBS 115572]PWY93059.1 hypothetical protein BO94DRAFT_583303 [Aspergillus sclerotioniger CBS 115572]
MSADSFAQGSRTFTCCWRLLRKRPDHEQNDAVKGVHATRRDKLMSPETQYQWLKDLRSILGQPDRSLWPQIRDNYDHFDLIGNVRASSPTRGVDFCLMLITYHTDVNLMLDTSRRRLGLDIEPYHEGPVPVYGGSEQTPIGLVKLEWAFYGRERFHNTVFYVVEQANFDLLMKMPSPR